MVKYQKSCPALREIDRALSYIYKSKRIWDKKFSVVYSTIQELLKAKWHIEIRDRFDPGKSEYEVWYFTNMVKELEK